MQRMYRALLWLSAVGVVVGFVIVSVQALNAGQINSSPFDDGTQPNTFVMIWLPALASVSEYFCEGAALLAVAVSWADRRNFWMIGLAIVTVGAIIFPLALEYVMIQPDFFVIHPRVGRLVSQYAFIIFNAVSLPPATLALVFAWRRRAGDLQSARAEADAALEITRSAL